MNTIEHYYHGETDVHNFCASRLTGTRRKSPKTTTCGRLNIGLFSFGLGRKTNLSIALCSILICAIDPTLEHSDARKAARAVRPLAGTVSPPGVGTFSRTSSQMQPRILTLALSSPPIVTPHAWSGTQNRGVVT